MPTPEEIDAACDQLAGHLDDMRRDPRVNAMLAHYDQIRAACRDDPAKRQAAVNALVEIGCDRDDAEEWIDKGCMP